MGAQGSAVLDFGAFPGASDASVPVTGQTGIVSGSAVEAWLRPEATADHTADEHMVETLKVFAHTISAGVGFTISGFNTNQINEPLEELRGLTTGLAGSAVNVPPFQRQTKGGAGTRIWGRWTVSWVWN